MWWLTSLLWAGALRAETPAPPPTSAASRSDAADDDRKLEAQARFQHGLAFARALNWEAALVEFNASRRVYPTRSAARNAAVALQKLGRHVEACEVYEALLEEFGGSMPSELLQQTRLELKLAYEQTAQLVFGTAARDVSVVVDGKQRGVTPIGASIRLDPGGHTVRLAKPGFETKELSLSLNANAIQDVDVTLEPLTYAGGLTVRESTGRQLDVLVDASVVGLAPWTGNLATGVHAIQLRGAGNLGTSPLAVTIKPGQTGELTLRAVPLESWAHVEPQPRHANVFIDGVAVGLGTWEGRLTDGAHRFEATAPGYLPFRADLRLARGEHRVVVAPLERDTADAPRRARRRLSVYSEIGAGPLLARTFGGDADSACHCSERDRPLGVAASLRFGVTLLHGLALEASGGYLRVSEEMTRQVVARGEDVTPTWRSSDYVDSTRLSGPTVALGAAYRAFHALAFTARAAFGLAFLRSTSTNFGTFAGSARDASHPAERVQRNASIAEADHDLLTPFSELELRIGRHLTKKLSVDLGLGLRAYFPPRVARTRADGADRSGVLPAGTWTDGTPLRPGLLWLPPELVARPFLAVTPNLGLRLAF